MKNFLKKNKVYVLLGAVLLVCFIIMATVLIKNFYSGGAGATKYGNRLDPIENIPIEDSTIEAVKNAYVDNAIVESTSVRVSGRIVYINMYFTADATLDAAKELAPKALEQFSEEQKSVYDFNITMKQNMAEESTGFIISGAKNTTSANIIWTNNNIPVE